MSKASSNFLSEEYGQRFQIKQRGDLPGPTLWWASCSCWKKTDSAETGDKNNSGILGQVTARSTCPIFSIVLYLFVI